MNREEESTPISKYLASMDRRHSLLASGTVGMPSTPSTPGILSLAKNFNFSDDTFLSDDHSLLQIPSPRQNKTALSELVSALPERKRKRTLYVDDGEKLQQKCDDLERLLRHTQIDLIDSRSVITTLQHQKTAAETAYKEKLISLERANSEVAGQLKTALEKVKALEDKVVNLTTKESETVESHHQQNAAHSNLVCSLQNRIMKLQNENCELKQKYDEEIQKNADIIRKLSSELEGTERGAEKWIIESQTLRDQLVLTQNQLQKCQNELKESQSRLIKLEEMKSKYEESFSESDGAGSLNSSIKKFENLYVNEQLKSRRLAAQLKKLEDENSILRSTVSEEMILKEQIASLEMRVAYMTGELKEKVACDEERKALLSEVQEWKNVACKLSPRCTTPVNFEAYLRQNQNQLLEYKHDISTLQLELQSKTEQLKKIQSENAALREQAKQLKDLSDKTAQELKKTSKRLVLIAKDRDSLKGLKDSYEQEFEGHCPKALFERNQQLEALIAKYETLISDDPSFAKRPCETCEEYAAKIEALTSELNGARQELSQKTANLVASQNQLSKLESVDSDLSYRIISFGKNPSAMSIEEKLREVLGENERLKANLQQLNNESRLDGLNTTVVEEKRALEERMKALERKHEILTDAYDYETGQLQTAIERLFGYHIILVREPHSQIRLQSVHSPNPDNMFIFQAAENDWMLLETPVLDLFRQEIENYLLTDGNIPAFLAMVTIKYSQSLLEEPQSQESERGGAGPRNEQEDRRGDNEEDEEEEEENDPNGREGREDEHDDEDDGMHSGEDQGSENDRSDYSEEEEDDDDDDSDGDRGQPSRGNGSQRPRYDDDDDDDDEIIMLD